MHLSFHSVFEPNNILPGFTGFSNVNVWNPPPPEFHGHKEREKWPQWEDPREDLQRLLDNIFNPPVPDYNPDPGDPYWDPPEPQDEPYQYDRLDDWGYAAPAGGLSRSGGGGGGG